MVIASSCKPSAFDSTRVSDSIQAAVVADSLRIAMYERTVALKQHQLDSILLHHFYEDTMYIYLPHINRHWENASEGILNTLVFVIDDSGNLHAFSQLATSHEPAHNRIEVISGKDSIATLPSHGYDYSYLVKAGECRRIFPVAAESIAELVVADTSAKITVNAYADNKFLESYVLSSADKQAIRTSYRTAILVHELRDMEKTLEIEKRAHELNHALR